MPISPSAIVLLTSEFQFQLERGSESIDMELTEVSELRVSRQCVFLALHLLARRDMFLTQETYRFHHPALGEIDLFIAATSARTSMACTCQAIFNRLRDREEV